MLKNFKLSLLCQLFANKMWQKQQLNNLREKDNESFYYEELSEEAYKRTFYCAIKPGTED